MLAVALTGGIGSGKSSVANIFSRLGVPVIDADAISRSLTSAGSPVLELIAQAFGADYIGSEGHLDRSAMRSLVFSDPQARARLESILHPRIRQQMRERLAQLSTPYAVLEIPLLFESGQTDVADRILVVDVPESEQIRRVQRRSGLTVEEIQGIIAAQVPRAERLRRADDVIDNSGGEGALQAQVERLHRFYLNSAAGG